MKIPDLTDLLNGLPLPVVLVDKNERISQMNGLASSMLGAGILGRHFITGLRQPGLLDAIEQVFVSHSTKRTRYQGREGDQDVTWDVTCAAFRDTDGQFAGVMISFTDVSDLENAVVMRRDFVANVSHELRTPLTALSGFIETLNGAAKDDPGARARFLGIMENETSRMNRLVGDLLSLSRVESDERMRPTDEVGIGALLRSVTQVLKPLATDQNCDLSLNLPENDVILTGDRDQLQQVFTNLIENALKYGGRNKSVSITTEMFDNDPLLRAPTIRILVQDQGEGIAAEHIPRLTERFYRIDGHRSREMGGTGLGLAIVKHIINRHRGRLRIESAPGQGSCFTVILRRENQA